MPPEKLFSRPLMGFFYSLVRSQPMPIVVHITDAKNVRSIQRSGIRPSGNNGAVYLMPLTPNHLVSHQWLRELKRSGTRQLVGIYLRIPSDEKVWVGHYNQPHQLVTLGEAIRQLNELHDPLGFEMFVCRKVETSEIQKVRSLPQVIGWRHMPHAHGRALCGCPVCLPKGSIKSSALRKRLDPKIAIPSLQAIQNQIASARNADDLLESLWPLRMKRRRIDSSFLEPLLSIDDEYLLQELASTLPYFRHPKSIEMLHTLSEHSCPEVSSAARDGLASFEQSQATPNAT